MMTSGNFILVVLGMGAVTYICRWLPLIFFSRHSLPEWFTHWLDMIPAAILGALLLPELVMTGHPRHIELLRPESVAAIPTFIVAILTRSLGWTVIAGMVFYGILQYWFL